MYKYDNGIAWSNDQELFWDAGLVGETLELPLPVQKAGKYRLIAHYTKSPENGIIQANLNGSDVGQAVDFTTRLSRRPIQSTSAWLLSPTASQSSR